MGISKEDKDKRAAEAVALNKSPKAIEKTSGKTRKVKFLLPSARKFKLAYHIGEVGELEEKQAAEIVGAKYGEYVK